MQMWKGIGNTTTLLFSLNGLKVYMMVLPENAGGKLVPRSDLCIETASRRTTSKEINFNIETWNLIITRIISTGYDSLYNYV